MKEQPFELAILSPDNFPLLDKMRKELIEVGYENTTCTHGNLLWNDWMERDHFEHPEIMGYQITCMEIQDDNTLSFHNHDCVNKEQVTLTASNYNEILTRCKEAINK